MSKTKSASVAVILCLIGLVKNGHTQECAPYFPNFTGASQHSPMLQRQLLIPHYTFPCNTMVTQWEAQLHWHGRRQQLTRIDFQIWRLDGDRGEYHLVGNNSYSANSQHQGVLMQGDRLVMNIGNPEYLISAAAGDIVGMFIQGEGVEMEYKPSKSVHTYLANLSGPRLEVFDADLEHDSVFRRDFKGAPLIRAITHNNDFTTMGSSSLVTQAPSATLSTSLNSEGTSSEAVPDKDITIEHWTEPSSPAKWNIEHLIGGIIGGAIIVLIVVCIVLGLLLIQRKKRGNVTAQSSPTTSEFLKSSSSEGTLLSYLHLDATRKLNLFAFKRQKSAHKNAPKPAGNGGAVEVRHQELILVSPDDHKAEMDCIKMDRNMSYSALSSGAENDTNIEYGYDVPLSEITVQPLEYEMPVETSVQMQNEYETIPDLDEDRIYEEIRNVR